MKITLINPPLVTQLGDFFGSGIPYMPSALAYLAAYLLEKKADVKVIDAFGEKPKKTRFLNGFFYQGLEPKEVLHRIEKDTDIICFYAGMVWNHEANVELIRFLREKLPKKTFIALENINQVTAYSLDKVYDEFFRLGIDYILTSDLELSFDNFVNGKKNGIIKRGENIERSEIEAQKKEFVNNLDNLPFPAWQLFPIKNYWSLGYSHAPLSSKKYLSILTSRGCPFNCNFCIVPGVSRRRWSPRSAKNVVDEMEYFNKKMDVKEYHFIDLNPSIRKERIKEISNEIISRRLKIFWKLGQGTKIETLDKETIEIMARAGCNYISFSPESGSKRVLNSMNKYFNHKFALDMLRVMGRNKVTAQSCFILGYPKETKSDLCLTEKYVKELVKNGVDEIALFIMTPIPGSKVFETYYKGFERLNQLTFSPKWRKEYKELARFRALLYLKFFLWQIFYHPAKSIGKLSHFVTGRFKTKMEMTLFRTLKVYWFFIRSKIGLYG